MDCKSHERKGKKQRNLKSDLSIEYKEKSFNNRYSIAQKCPTYSALRDPHTSYHFSNRKIRHHLKQLKRAIKAEAHLPESVRLTQLINQRLSEKYERWLNPKTIVYQNQIKSLEKNSLQRIARSNLSWAASRSIFYQCGIDNKEKSCKTNKVHFSLLSAASKPSLPLYSKIKQRNLAKSCPLKSRNQYTYANKLFDDLHSKKRRKWTNFLEEKINSLSCYQDPKAN